MNPFKVGDEVVITGDLEETEELCSVTGGMERLRGKVMVVERVWGDDPTVVKANGWAWAVSDLSLVNFSLENE